MFPEKIVYATLFRKKAACAVFSLDNEEHTATLVSAVKCDDPRFSPDFALYKLCVDVFFSLKIKDFVLDSYYLSRKINTGTATSHISRILRDRGLDVTSGGESYFLSGYEVILSGERSLFLSRAADVICAHTSYEFSGKSEKFRTFTA